MNHLTRVIIVIMAVGVSIAFALASSLPVAPVYLDDVYYWQDDDEEQPQQSYESTPGTESVSVTKPATKTEPRVIFLDDSITRQNPDTIVRVRIKR